MHSGDLCAYSFYFILNVFTYFTLLSLSTSLTLEFHICFGLLACCAYYLLITTKNNPGKVINPPTVDNVKETTQIDDQEAVMKSNVNEIELSRQFTRHCEICNVDLPLRGRHCTRCNMCIRKYDHHCGLIGGCVGEDNHLKFLLFLFTQTSALLFAISAILRTISDFLDLYHENYSKVPFALFALLAILSAYCLLTVFLFLFHVYLIFTNQTTFEIYHKNKAEYVGKFANLKKSILEKRNIVLPGSFKYHPFDMGMKRNLKCLVKQTNWQDVFIENLHTTEIRFNCCENQYWSCF